MLEETPLTLEALLTPAGMIAAGAIITKVVDGLKLVAPAIDERVSGALMSVIVSAVLYVFVGIAIGLSTLNEGFQVFMAWLTVSSAAIGINGATRHVSLLSARQGPVDDPIVDVDLPEDQGGGQG